MKKILLSLVLLVSCFLPLISQVIWSADPEQSTDLNQFFRRFDSGNYPQDYCVTQGDEAGVAPSRVTTPTDPTHGKVWKVNKPQDRKRGELARAEGETETYSAREGDDIYIGWRWKIDTENGQNIKEESTVWQWKSEGAHDQNYPINMEYDGDLTLNAWGPDYTNSVSQASRRTVLWRRAVPQNTWVTLVVRIKVEKENFGGLVQFWFNGQQQELSNSNFNNYRVNLSPDRLSAFHRTNDGTGVYPKWGIYNKKSCAYNASAYFDDMKIGRNLNAVMPSGNTVNTPPTITLTSPSNGDTYALGQSIDLRATANDDGAVAKVNFKVNGEFYSQDSDLPYLGTFTPTQVGTYVIGARAFDAQDLQTESTVTITVTQPNRPPTGIFTAPLADQFMEGYPELYIRVNETDLDGDSVDITLFMDEVEIRTEENGPFEWGHVTAAGTDLRSETLGLTEGEHVLKAVLVDAKGATNTITKTIRVNRVVTATQQQTLSNMSIYPNPSETGIFYLNQPFSYRVLGLKGDQVLQGHSNQIDLSAQPQGVYILSIGSQKVKLVR